MGKIVSAVGKAGAMAAVATAGLETANRLWVAANKDGRAVRVLEDLATRIETSRTRADVAKVLGSQLDAIDQAVDDLEAVPGVADEATWGKVKDRWSKEAAILRTKVAPLAAMEPRERKKARKELCSRVNALLDEIMAFGLPPVEEPGRRRSPLRRRRD